MFKAHIISGNKGFAAAIICEDTSRTFKIVPLGNPKNEWFYSKGAAEQLAERHAANLNKAGATIETMKQLLPHLVEMA